MVINAHRNALDVFARHEHHQLFGGSAAAAPRLLVSCARLVELWRVDAEKADLSFTDHQGVTVFGSADAPDSLLRASDLGRENGGDCSAYVLEAGHQRVTTIPS
jgi:hypothetical protein